MSVENLKDALPEYAKDLKLNLGSISRSTVLNEEQLWGTLSLVGEPSVKVKTERGDYRGFYANVRDAIEKKAALDVTPEQALRTMRAVMLAHKSSRERRTVEWGESVE